MKKHSDMASQEGVRMNNILKSLIFRQLAIECDNSHKKRIEDVWGDCRKKLVLDGLSNGILDEIDFKSQILPKFKHRLLPNPDYWKKNLEQEFTFLIIEVKSGNYQILLNTLKKLIPDVTYFVCYGEKDVIIRLLGEQSTVTKLENVLLSLGIQSTTIFISEVLLFYDKKVPTNEKYQDLNINQKEIDLFLASDPTSIPQEIFSEMEEKGLVLNTVVFENTHLTGRIRALIEIKMEHTVTDLKTKKIEKALCNLNDIEYSRKQSRPISSIYKCYSPFFAYLIEGIFDDQEQLDSLTDSIQEIELIGDTETIILAKAYFPPFSFSKHIIGELDVNAIMKPLVKESILPLSQKFSDKFPDLNQKFLEDTPEKQFVILSIFNDLIINADENYFKEYPKINDYLNKYFEGILEGKLLSIQNAGLGYIRDVIEKEHNNFVQIIVTNILQDKSENIQNTFGIGNAEWTNWGLFKWGRICYSNWNNDRIYSRIVKLPNEILNDFEYLGISRNIFAHSTNLDDINKLIYMVRNVFLRSFNLLNWLENTRSKIENPIISLGDFRNIVSKINKDKINILSGIKFNQEEIKNLIRDINKKSNFRNDEVIKMLLHIQSSVDTLDVKTINSIKEMIIPLIDKKNRDTAENFVDFMKSVASSLPADVVSELLAFGLLSFLGVNT